VATGLLDLGHGAELALDSAIGAEAEAPVVGARAFAGHEGLVEAFEHAHGVEVEGAQAGLHELAVGHGPLQLFRLLRLAVHAFRHLKRGRILIEASLIVQEGEGSGFETRVILTCTHDGL
jgi:hypothetical protein